MNLMMMASLAGMVVSPKPIEADKTFLGTYANITPVKQNTWIYLDEDDGDILGFADKEGRQIRVDFDSNGNPMLFYLATPEKGKINSVRSIYNDYESMVYMTKQLVIYAANNYNSSDVTNDVLGYIRSFNKRYTSFKWTFVAGNINADFVSAADQAISEGLTFRNYYGSFAEDYNLDLHGQLNSEKELKMVDCLDANRQIDMIHMFASMDFINTQYMYKGYYTEHVCDYMEDLATWGGDLQSEIERQYGLKKHCYNTSFSSILSDEESSCSEADFLADIDAYNMMNQPSFKDQSLITKLENYYDYFLSQFKSRFGTFLTAEEQHTWNDSCHGLEAKVLELLHLNKQGDIYSDSGKVDLREYILAPNISRIPVSERASCANSFLNYIHTECMCESGGEK